MGSQLTELLAIHTPVTELVLQASAIYLLQFLLFRFVVRREVVRLGIGELVLLVLIADASQNYMTGEFTSLSEGVILAATIFAWHMLMRLLLLVRHRMARSQRNHRSARHGMRIAD